MTPTTKTTPREASGRWVASPIPTPLKRLATKARREAEKMRAAATERDRLIVEMREAGASLATIGEAVGMSRPGVLHVLRREETNGNR